MLWWIAQLISQDEYENVVFSICIEKHWVIQLKHVKANFKYTTIESKRLHSRFHSNFLLSIAWAKLGNIGDIFSGHLVFSSTLFNKHVFVFTPSSRTEKSMHYYVVVCNNLMRIFVYINYIYIIDHISLKSVHSWMKGAFKSNSCK